MTNTTFAFHLVAVSQFTVDFAHAHRHPHHP